MSEEYYEVKIPKTEGYSVVSFIQTPNSGAGVIANTVGSDLLKDDSHIRALEKLIGELITTAIGVLDKTIYSGHKFARFYHVGEDVKLVSSIPNFVEFELKDDR